MQKKHPPPPDSPKQPSYEEDPQQPAKLERMFECEYCGLNMRASNLGRHVKSRHEAEDAANEGKIKWIPVDDPG